MTPFNERNHKIRYNAIRILRIVSCNTLYILVYNIAVCYYVYRLSFTQNRGKVTS